MPYPALIYRADNAPPPRPRNRRATQRGARILARIEMLGVTMESVARRSGFSCSAIYPALSSEHPDTFLLDCVEQALDLPKWKG